MIRTVLIDIDNTLLDFDRCAEASIRQGLAELGLPWPKGMFPVFRRVNDTLWREIEKGNLTRPGLRAIRWPWIFDRFGIDADGEAVEDRFVQLLWDSHEPVDGAEEVLRHLSARYAVYAASNAPAGEQENRLRLAGFDRYFQGLFIFYFIGKRRIRRRQGNQLIKRCFCRFIFISFRFCIQCLNNFLCSVLRCKGINHQVCIAILFCCFLILCRTNSKQMPTIAKQTIICPIRSSRTYGYHRNIVDQEHHQCKNR